jgi:amino-acid N-acetyltransferase
VSTAAIRQARPDDLDSILRLLQTVGLPTDGIADHIATSLVAESQGAVIGAIALEPYGDTGLLRSAVVAPAHQNGGLGSALYEKLLARAHSLSIKRMVLLTTTAERYFQRKGFHVIDRATLTGPITQSMEFRGACPASAVCMELHLQSDPSSF